MPTPVSPLNLTQTLMQGMTSQGVRAGLDGANSFLQQSFSSTLQGRLADQRAQPSEKPDIEPRTEPPARPREPERKSSSEAPRESGHKGSGDAGRRDETQQAGQSAETEAGAPADKAAADAAGRKGGKGEGGGEKSAGDAPAPGPTNAAAAAAQADGGNIDPALVAGLPAAIAALLPGQAGAGSTATDTELDLLAADGKQKTLQNPGLMPKTDAGAQGAGREGLNPALLLQARQATTLFADRQASALQALKGELPVQGGAQTGSTVHHGLNTLASLRHPQGAAATMPQLPVSTPAGRSAWAEDVGNQVRWMLGRAESKAELVLTPPNLGKLEVSINLNGDQTTAQFVASNQAAREALEQSLPRLREILQQAGISLGQTSVSTSGEQQAGAEGNGSGGRGGRSNDSGEALAEGGSASAWLRQHDGLVDTFA